MKFYECETCKKIITMIDEKAVPTMCCGKPMEELVPGTSDGAAEKHVPVVAMDGKKVTVCVGDVPHPMLEEHYIEWIVVETTAGYQLKRLQPGEEPKAEFLLADGEDFVAAYEYCNLHRLWKKEK